MTTEEKLDQLAEFESQRDNLDAQKAALLAENKVPATVQGIVSAGMKAMSDASKPFEQRREVLRRAAAERLAEIVVPEEIKAQLAEIDRLRTLINTTLRDEEMKIDGQILDRKEIIMKDVDAETTEAYKAIETRKAEIEAEFAGSLDAVNANIEALKAEIKAETVAKKETIKGKFYQSIYTAGRITWNTDMMEGWRETFPFLEKARKEGQPSTQLRRV